jgi:hypothetical protein
MESYNRRTFAELTGCDPDFVQDNHSRSARASPKILGSRTITSGMAVLIAFTAPAP